MSKLSHIFLLLMLVTFFSCSEKSNENIKVFFKTSSDLKLYHQMSWSANDSGKTSYLLIRISDPKLDAPSEEIVFPNHGLPRIKLGNKIYQSQIPYKGLILIDKKSIIIKHDIDWSLIVNQKLEESDRENHIKKLLDQAKLN